MSARILVLDIEKRLVTSPAGCLEWQGATARGYGVIRRAGRNLLVHRVMCEHTNGPAPAGKGHALHRCNNRRCANGQHLYWGNDKNNADDRKAAGSATGGRVYATSCINDHEFTGENTYREPRGRGCKTCRREAVRRYRQRRAAA